MGKYVKLNELESMQAYSIIPDPEDREWQEDGHYLKCQRCGDMFKIRPLNKDRLCVDCEFIDDV